MGWKKIPGTGIDHPPEYMAICDNCDMVDEHNDLEYKEHSFTLTRPDGTKKYITELLCPECVKALELDEEEEDE